MEPPSALEVPHARVLAPFYDENVRAVSDTLWLPVSQSAFEGVTEPPPHWCAGSFVNTESNSWFTIQEWVGSDPTPNLLENFDDAHFKIGPTEDELTEAEKLKKKELAAQRAADKQRKAEEKAATPSKRKKKQKSPAQLAQEVAREQKKKEKEAEKEARRLARVAKATEKAAKKAAETAKKPPPTQKQLEKIARAKQRRAEKKATAATATKTIRLYPSPAMKFVLKRWMGCYRVIYNKALALSKATKPPKSFDYYNFIRAAVTNEENIKEPWLKTVPSSIRIFAAMDVCQAFWSNIAKQKKSNGQHAFQLRFKSRKDPSQVLKVRHNAIHKSSAEADCFRIFPAISKKEVESWCTSNGIQFQDEMLNIRCNPKELSGVSLDKDVVIKMDTLGRFWIHCPYRREPATQAVRSKCWAALDPGDRVFLTGYAPSGSAFKLGVHASDRIRRLAYQLDDLVSRTALLANVFKRKKNFWGVGKKKRVAQKISRMKRAQQRLRFRVKNLVAELHWRCATWIVSRYSDIIIPPFETQEMVDKEDGRCTRNKTARSLMTFSHFLFRKRLLHVAAMKGARVYVRPEDYTTKSCTNCGFIHDGIGSSEVFKCPSCGLITCRDVAAARNLFLKSTVVVQIS